jgi:hypothetical protein
VSQAAPDGLDGVFELFLPVVPGVTGNLQTLAAFGYGENALIHPTDGERFF